MAGGRPPKGPRLVDGLAGSREAKRRLRLMLETIAGTRSVESACEELGIGEAMFHRLRARTLQEAVEGLEPRPVGRPSARSLGDEHVETLQGEIKSLRQELEAARLRVELATALPTLGRRGKRVKKGR